MKTPTGIHVEVITTFNNRTRATACWTLDEARYHVWFSIVNGKPILDRESGVIYKNDPQDNNKTRRLDATSKSNAQIIKHVFEAIEDGAMLKIAIAAKVEQDRRADVKQQQNAVDQRRDRFVKLLAEMDEHDHDVMIDAISAQLSMDDIDALQERLP